jgi:MFS family permease
LSFQSLLRREGAVIGFGFAFTFGSSLGQTFFIALFVPGIAHDLNLSLPFLAAVYAVATLASALCLPTLGRLLDRVDLPRFGLSVAVALAAGSVLLASASAAWMVLAGFFALRLAGQGLMSHVALTGAARYFDTHRGKALSLTGLGHAAGEGLLPLAAVSLILLIGWRATFLTSAVVLAVLLAPAAAFFVRRNRRFREPWPAAVGRPSARRKRPNPLLRSKAFWRLLPLLVAGPFTVTALIFHQGWLAASLGLPLTVMAAAFIGFALVQIPAALVSGSAVDRLGSRRLLQLHALPMMGGVAVLFFAPDAWAVWIYLGLAGVTNAVGGLLRTSMIAELAPPDQLGAARSFVSACMVVSTAAGPAVYGLFIAAGASGSGLLAVAFASLGLAAVPSLNLRRRRRPVPDPG